jgi:CubicO group peptidase (beta-lactamase class C family)
LQPGYVVGRFDGTSTVVAQGHIDLQQSELMRPDSIFRIDSLTKPVIAMALLIVLEEKSIPLAEPIAQGVPEFAQPRILVDPMGRLDRTVAALRKITPGRRSGLSHGDWYPVRAARKYAHTAGD